MSDSPLKPGARSHPGMNLFLAICRIPVALFVYVLKAG
jgi:hypothetical protein